VSAGTAEADLPFPIVVTRGPQHVVSWANPAARSALPALAVGRPLCDAGSQPPLLPLLDRVVERGEATAVELVEPAMTVGLVPMAGGMVLYGIPGSAGVTGARERGVALQRLAGELLGAATPTEIGRLAVTTAAALLGADAAGAYTRTDAGTLEALHAAGWPDETTRLFERIALRRGRPLSDAVLDGVPVWLEDAAQWRARYPEMAPVGTSVGMQATACLPCGSRTATSQRLYSVSPARAPSRRTSATTSRRSPRSARRRSTGPAARRRAGRAGGRRAAARAHDLPPARRTPHGGAVVGGGAVAAARRPGRADHGGPRGPGQDRLCHPAAGAVPAGPGRPRRRDLGQPYPASRRSFPTCPTT
jgi:hypothetical protein